MDIDSNLTRAAAGNAEFPRIRIGVNTPSWFLRWKLTWVLSDIDEVERRLGDEFALAETAPLTREHIALLRERDALMGRLTTPAGVPATA